MKMLAIETSCDDTCLSILEKKGRQIKLLSQTISSQEKLHARYGGVFPSLAKREHQNRIVPLLERTLDKANLLKPAKKINSEKMKATEKILIRNPELFAHLKLFLEKFEKPNINQLAVTIGPGLEPCLWVGVNLAKALSFNWNLPIYGVNHLEGHLISAWLEEKTPPPLPAIGLIVSGGNTQLILMKDIGKYKIIGETRDDAAGECFDKTARLLGLPYPGGREISKQAKNFKAPVYNIHLPRPMLYEKNYDFSFSGLKTAVLYDYKKRKESERTSPEYITEMSKEIQNAIIEVLLKKTIKAVQQYKAKSIILGGGVSANEILRSEIKKACQSLKIKYFLPKNEHTVDNASMIALAAATSPKPKIYLWKKIKPKPNFKL